MSKVKKLLSVLIAVTMLVSMVAISANAAYYYENETDAASYTQTWALDEPTDNGDGSYSVNVRLTTNYATGAIQFVITNTDTSVAALSGVTLGSAIPESYNADISYNAKTGKVVIIPSTSGVDTITGSTINGVIAVLTYTYSGTGSATIAIENSPKSETNVGGTLIAARPDDGDLVTGKAITGQTVTSTGVSRTIGNAAVAPTLAVIDGTIGVIDTTRTDLDLDNGTTCDGYIYGIDPGDLGETVDSAFEVVGDGTMNIVANDMGSECGTGTMVQVLDNSGDVVATYVLIVFGDVDGDGVADLTDASNIDLHDAYLYGDTGRLLAYQEFAGDLNCDGAADLTDVSDLQLHDAYLLGDTGRIDVATIISNLGM